MTLPCVSDEGEALSASSLRSSYTPISPLLDLPVRVDVNHERVKYGVPEIVHLLPQLVHHLVRDLRLLEEDLVELDLGDGAANDVEDVGGDLPVDVREAVKGGISAFWDDLVLNANRNLYEDVVLRLSLNAL